MDKTAPPTAAELKGLDELNAFLDRAQKGDKTTLPRLIEFLKEPSTVDLFGGNLAYQAQKTLINKYCGENLLCKESLTRKLHLLRDELSGPSPTPLERLLVERIVTCWLHLYHLEAIYGGKDSMSLELAAHYQRCLTAAQKRYLAAIKTLALVRKLAVPVLQVNIARKQVNVAGSCVAAGGEKESP